VLPALIASLLLMATTRKKEKNAKNVVLVAGK
jgi:hypothetical protein